MAKAMPFRPHFHALWVSQSAKEKVLLFPIIPKSSALPVTLSGTPASGYAENVSFDFEIHV
ncbi:MAG: hypothetical protein ACRD18_07265 [Terriglobia bacterium]